MSPPPDQDDAPGGRFLLWSLREDVHVEADAGKGAVILHSRWGDESVPHPAPQVVDALRRMSLGPVSLENAVTDPAGRAELDRLLGRLQHLVVRSLGLDQERALLSVVPLSRQARFEPARLSPVRALRMSRFAVLHAEDGAYSLESPLSLHRVVLHRAEAMWLIGTLSRATTPAAVLDGLPSPMPAGEALGYLVATGMVVQAEPGGSARAPVFAEDTDPALVTWLPQDLMFHTRSTLGRHDRDFGATYPMGERWTVEPVTKPATEGGYVPLPRPSWNRLIASDPPLTAAIEGHRPTRRFAREPLTARQLGEVLYRTARVRSLVGSAGGLTGGLASDRPYASTGSAYELELYAAVRGCPDITDGMYHYDPLGHRLEPIDMDAVDLCELVERGRTSAGLATAPPVLILVTARFRRVSWKYTGPGYALILKNTGALVQTLYLVSAAMGLTGCALDAADIEVTTRALGTDWRTESCVSGFALGHGDEEPAGPPAGRRPANDAAWGELATELLPKPSA
ncbi:SagB-type dehydrogenase domain-containing protein [Sphaerisporangium melleum]|uniref:SagB-type dehydrogenase domain-containing protein n=1 Tax=Sphaerisporangium melleum TaxID=321316 RepID=A0A917RG32_9ACTN|nr:SagB family peptide dehydrogenase [Sphaerisporangium melleum]GGL06212.1 SagB-type dehydrogenase domain-containing protein [Sphaerisporangium melleum]GII73106.1 SagB-type dehydrogenase domain-containing protein [Sphaerisporangium melleum]